eukprot:TRINITY_DN1373_c0_g4_i1.p2 TRINITY_DN1373_c0_g4~~TRINITY_DN1373_c0_g4_i1.p2  ORF type:complete len:174 (+),score=47.19 TRINITY_DN1373_c0_g4_i1:108-629(+)
MQFTGQSVKSRDSDQEEWKEGAVTELQKAAASGSGGGACRFKHPTEMPPQPTSPRTASAEYAPAAGLHPDTDDTPAACPASPARERASPAQGGGSPPGHPAAAAGTTGTSKSARRRQRQKAKKKAAQTGGDAPPGPAIDPMSVVGGYVSPTTSEFEAYWREHGDPVSDGDDPF